MRGFITALRTLTIVPVLGEEADRPQGALFFFPIVGGFVGLLTAAAAWLIGVRAGWPLGAGVVCVALSSLVTGAIHLDGLADGFDALGGRTRERRMEIMKDSSVGAYGVVALLLVLTAKVVAIARLSGSEHLWWIIVPYVISRLAQVELMALLPYARPGAGTGRDFVEGTYPRHFFLSCLPAAVLCAAAGMLCGAAVLTASCVVCLPFASWLRRKFGGATGDLLGMGSELFETLGLVTLGMVSSL